MKSKLAKLENENRMLKARVRKLLAYVKPIAKLDGHDIERWVDYQGFNDWLALPSFVVEARKAIKSVKLKKYEG